MVRARPRISMAVLGLLVGVAGRPDAGLMISMQEVGPDVVVSVSGTANTAGLTQFSTWDFTGQSRLDPHFGHIALAGSGLVYSGISGPTQYGPGHLTTSAESVTGQGVFFNVVNGIVLGLPTGYVSGSALSGHVSFAGTT